MSQTKEGAKKVAAANLARDPDFYKRIGSIGGKNGNTGGFASEKISDDGLTGKQRASIAGSKGGRISRRRKIVL